MLPLRSHNICIDFKMGFRWLLLPARCFHTWIRFCRRFIDPCDVLLSATPPSSHNPLVELTPFLKANLKINRFVTGGQHRKTKFALFVFLCGILFFHVGTFIRHASHLNANLWSSAFVSPLSAVRILMPQMLKHRTGWKNNNHWQHLSPEILIKSSSRMVQWWDKWH